MSIEQIKAAFNKLSPKAKRNLLKELGKITPSEAAEFAELFEKKFKKHPAWEFDGHGYEDDKSYTATVSIPDSDLNFSDRGRTKISAQQKAAKKALEAKKQWA